MDFRRTPIIQYTVAVILTDHELLAKVLLSCLFNLIAIDYIATLSALFLRMVISHMQAKSL